MTALTRLGGTLGFAPYALASLTNCKGHDLPTGQMLNGGRSSLCVDCWTADASISKERFAHAPRRQAQPSPTN